MEINDIEASNDTIYEEHNDFNLCWPMAIVSCPISGKPAKKVVIFGRAY